MMNLDCVVSITHPARQCVSKLSGCSKLAVPVSIAYYFCILASIVCLFRDAQKKGD
jgi:hypothetical protein